MIGKFKNRITIQKKSTTPDTGGGQIVSWMNVEKSPVVWAMVTPIATERGNSGFQNLHPVTYRIRLRHRTDLSTDNRILLSGKALALTSVLDTDGRRRFLDILATEEAP